MDFDRYISVEIMKVLMDKGLKGSELLKEIENKKKDLRLKIDDWINELREVK